MIFSRFVLVVTLLVVVVCMSTTTTLAFSPAAFTSKAAAAAAAAASRSLAASTSGGDDDNNNNNNKNSDETSTQTALSRRGFVNSLVAAAAAAAATVATTSWTTTTTTAAWAAADLNPKTSFSQLETGRMAPNFELPSSRGSGSTSLKELTKTGKWTVLYFYPGAFSTGCTLEAKAFQRDMDEYRTKYNAQIVGVSVDPPEKNQAFCSATGLDFYMLSDVGGKVSTEYGSAVRIPGFGTFSNRQTYLIDPQGKLQWVFTGVENRIPTHSKEVLAKLEEIQSGGQQQSS